MKTKTLLLLSVIFISLVSCRRDPIPGPMGPTGPRGPQGDPGPAAYLWETQFNFTSARNYTHIWEFPNFTVYDTDLVLAYILDNVYDDGFGDVDVWKPLPAHYYETEGFVYYSFTHSFHDVAFTMQTDNSDFLIPAWTNGVVMRIVLIEGYWADNNRASTVDLNDYNAVKEHFNLEDPAVKERKRTSRK